jgi:hypothetical protein
MQKTIMVLLFVLLSLVPAGAREIAGVDLPEQLSRDDGTALSLNGAGIRSKFFFKIYIAALYLENPATSVDAVLADEGGKRMAMHFLYSEVSGEDLVEAWNEGFTGNGTPEQLETLAPEIAAFNKFFTGVKSGDTIVLDYLPGVGTAVVIRGEQQGVIAGKPFNDLLLSIWLGKQPVDEDLRAALLGS